MDPTEDVAAQGPAQFDAGRATAIGIALLVALGGFLADLFGIHRWGPESDQWVTASGLLFWVALAALIVSGYDTVAVGVPAVRRVRQTPSGLQRVLGVLQGFGRRHHIWIGVISIVLGLLFGHFLWSPS